MEEKSIILTNGKQPELIGQWTIDEVIAASEFLRRWIGAQKIAVQPAPQEPPSAAGIIDDPLPTPPYSPAKVQNL